MKLYFKKLIRYYSFIFVLAIGYTTTAYSQSEQLITNQLAHKNAVIVEGMGHGAIYSLNYERILLGNEKTFTSGKIGIAYYGKKSGFVPLWVPISLNQSIRLRRTHYLEVGVGKLFTNDAIQDVDGSFEDDYQLEEWIFRLGYRHHFKNDKWLLKVAYTPIYQDKSEYIHWGGVAFGYRF